MPTSADKAAATRQVAARRMDLLRVRHLKLLQLVASTGSLTAAAQELRISQPASTKLLQELERAVGCSLVDRSVRGGSLSAAGQRTLERMRIAIGALDAVAQAGATPPYRPLVRIGTLPLVGVELIPRMVALLSERGQLPRLTIHESTVAAVLAVAFLMREAWWVGIPLGIMLVITATLGDLVESQVKRDLGIKDMGTLLPGHGGLMDRIDGALPSAVATWIVLSLLA